MRGARWAPLYDARLDSGTRERKPALELVRRAEIVQQTGEDWSDVALSVSTVRTAKGGSGAGAAAADRALSAPHRRRAAERRAAYRIALRARGAAGRQSRATQSGRERRRLHRVASGRAQEQEAAIETGGYQAVFRIPGRVTVATNEGAKSFRISTATIAPDLLVRAVPALDETAYLEAALQACRGSAAACRAASRSTATASSSDAA